MRLTFDTGEGGADAHDWLQLIVIPVGLYVVQQIVSGWIASRITYRRQMILTGALRDEVGRYLDGLVPVRDQFTATLDDGKLQKKIEADAAYVVFSADAETVSTIFKPQTGEFYFLRREVLSAAAAFYDTNQLAAATLASLKSDVFKALAPDRKLAGIRKCRDELARAVTLGLEARRLLGKERSRLDASPLRLLFMLGASRAPA